MYQIDEVLVVKGVMWDGSELEKRKVVQIHIYRNLTEALDFQKRLEYSLKMAATPNARFESVGPYAC